MKTRVIQDDPVTNTFAGWVRDHRLISFFVLAYVLSWWPWVLSWFGLWSGQPFQAVGVLIAIVIVIAVAEGRAGFADLGRRMIRWRVPWYYYAFALLVPLVVRGLITTLNDAAPAPDWLELSWGSFALMFLLRLVNPMDGPLAEEPSWRGFAVPRMQERTGPLATAAILGVLVAAWHLPLIDDTGWIGIVTTFVITFVYVWLFNRTDGSVLLVLLFHNAQGFVTMVNLGYTGDALARQQWMECVAWTVIALTLIVADRSHWRRISPAGVVEKPHLSR